MKTASHFALLVLGLLVTSLFAQEQSTDSLREFQFRAAESKTSDYFHWGTQPGKFSNWTNHSNRLIPVYTFGANLENYTGENSIYRDAERLQELYGQETVVTPDAEFIDQTDIYRLQRDAWKAGKKNVILLVFDGMDWQTTQAASIYKHKKVLYEKGKGEGLGFLDYDPGPGIAGFTFCVTSPHNGKTKTDVDTQVAEGNFEKGGGFNAELGGKTPWARNIDPDYLIGRNRQVPHPYTDSAASATSLNTGLKTYNGSINVGPDGTRLETLSRQMQKDGYAVGVVSSVPICHATPASVYANNVSRSDYQDIARDLIGLPSIAHRDEALPGVDVLIGCGFGEAKADDRKKQGDNYEPGNKYIADSDVAKIDVTAGGKYVIAQRTEGENGKEVLFAGAAKAADNNHRLFGFFGVGGGHLPYQTADGNYDPTRGVRRAERYEEADVNENPTLADMTTAALTVLSKNEKGFYLSVESGDVDWALHNNNIDDAIGAVYSGDDAFNAITHWVEANSNWDETCLIVTADHGHMFFLDDPKVLTDKKEKK